MTAMMEARAVKNVDEQECLRMVGAIGDGAHWEFMKALKPGITEIRSRNYIQPALSCQLRESWRFAAVAVRVQVNADLAPAGGLRSESPGLRPVSNFCRIRLYCG
jgi:hypothetical protein